MLLGVDVGTTHTKVGVYEEDGHACWPTPAALPIERWQPTDCHSGRRRPCGVTPPRSFVRRPSASPGRSRRWLSPAWVRPGFRWTAAGNRPILSFPGTTLGLRCRCDDSRRVLEPKGWFSITGLFPNPIHSIAKWVWLREVDPGAWDRTRLWLSICNYIGYRLTGGTVMEVSQACRTMAFDIRSGDWSAELIELAGLTTNFLPPVVSATDPVGTVTAEAASLVGLRPGTPVFAGGHDHVCAALACGCGGA